MKADSIRMADSVMRRLATLDSTHIADSLATANHNNRKNPPALPLEPTYKEGKVALEQFLITNTRYPEEAIKNKITGYVAVGFVVHQDGSLSDFKIVKALGYGCDEEALRVARLMPAWNPARLGSKPIEMNYSIAVKFGIK